MNMRQVAIGILLVAVAGLSVAEVASAEMARPAWRQRQNYRAPAVSNAASAQQRMTARTNSYSYQGGQGGWNANNTWFTQAPYGNYAPPPYATSRSAFYQVGPVP